MGLTEREKEELRAIASSASMRADSRRLRTGRINSFINNGFVDCSRVVEFLTEYNRFLDNPMKPHWSFSEKEMKL